MRWLKLALVFAAALSAVAQTPKNVILFIGDGMGPAHVTVARLIRDRDFQIGRMPVVGLVTTQSANDTVTDSGAAATALATGVKTNNETLSIDPAGQSRETVLEVAERAGKSTGLVTTSYFWDATPAAFAAHVLARTQTLDIVTQMLRSGVELIVGTGGERFGKEKLPALEELSGNAGFELARTRAGLEASRAPHILGVLPSQPRDVDVPDAPLPVLTRWAIERLSGDPDGFFLLVEQEGTDSSSHENNRADVQASLRSLDTAVGLALDFADRRGDTLVLVTGDHETGSLRISSTKTGRMRMEFATTEHTGTAVPVFAFGPGASLFTGFLDNTDIGKKLISFLGR